MHDLSEFHLDWLTTAKLSVRQEMICMQPSTHCSPRQACGSPQGHAMQGHPELSMAHVTVPDIRWVDWHALKAAGFKGCVFDKDNTLTEPYALGIHEPLTGSMKQCMDAFDGHVALLSNSAGLQEYDPKGKHVTCWQPVLMAPDISLHARLSLSSADTCESPLGQQSP